MLKRIKDSIFDILRQADWLLLCLCCGAALFGLVMIASATNFLNSWKMVIVQACAIVLGVGIYFLMSQIDLTEAAKRWKWLLGFGIVMFLLLKTPLGIENNGNRAWLGIQGFPANIQPAEIVKLTFILVLSRQLVWVKENWGLKSLRSIAFLAGHVLLMVGLYYVISSDMGSALVYIFIFAAMAFVAGVAARWFIIALLGGGAAFYLLWELDKIPDYMKERFMVVFDHDLDPLGAGWQQTRSLLALGGGKLTGQGLFHGIQTQGEYSGSLPFRYTDFIFSVICEQFGMLFGSCVLLMYVAIIWRGTSIAMAARTRFHGLLAMGCTAMLGLQTFIIIGGVIKLIPLTGVTMPFVSYGGTSLVACLCLIGLIQGVSSVNEDDLARDADLADYGGGAA